MVKCSHCGRDIDEKAALVHKDESGEKRIICTDCFEELAGIDYKTFAYRKESAKQTLFAMICCIAATVYAFVERGSATAMCRRTFLGAWTEWTRRRTAPG